MVENKKEEKIKKWKRRVKEEGKKKEASVAQVFVGPASTKAPALCLHMEELEMLQFAHGKHRR